MTKPGATVLVVDDDDENLASVCRIFQREGIETLAASNGKDALDLLRRPEICVLVTDLMMPGVDGQELLKASRALRPDVEVILMTAFGTVEIAVGAMRDGAYDFVTKPLKRHSLVRAVEKAMERRSLLEENADLRIKLADAGERTLIGQSPSFRAFMELLRQAAPSTATVLLVGESGTGKELAARFLHDNSLRARQPFVAVNCGALPESILEAELFGVERGAFTGAMQRREGRFKRADGGTLFLDEVAEMSLQAQVRLLRALQEGEIERLGGTQTIKVDVRVVAATNKDLQTETQEGRFREDLYYRLNVVEVRIPALAERQEDIALLAEAFLLRFADKNKKPLRGFDDETMATLERYAWPGNVRELEHAMERAVVLSRGEFVRPEDLPESVRSGPMGSSSQIVIPIGTPMEEVERRVIAETLRHTKNDKNLAARMLGIAARTIYRKLAAEEASTSSQLGPEASVRAGPPDEPPSQ